MDEILVKLDIVLEEQYMYINYIIGVKKKIILYFDHVAIMYYSVTLYSTQKIMKKK